MEHVATSNGYSAGNSNKSSLCDVDRVLFLYTGNWSVCYRKFLINVTRSFATEASGFSIKYFI